MVNTRYSCVILALLVFFIYYVDFSMFLSYSLGSLNISFIFNAEILDIDYIF